VQPIAPHTPVNVDDAGCSTALEQGSRVPIGTDGVARQASLLGAMVQVNINE
jgi:hypothetical protein